MNRLYQHNKTTGWYAQDITLQNGMRISLWSCHFTDYFQHRASVLSPFFGISYVLSGRALCQINRNAIEFLAGTPYLQFLTDISCSTEYKPGEYFYHLQICLPPKIFDCYWLMTGGSSRFTFRSFAHSKGFDIRCMELSLPEKLILSALVRELEAFDQTQNRLLLECRCLELLSINLCRLNGREHCKTVHSCKKETMERAREILLTRLENPPTLTELSRIVGTNECTLKRGFKETFGCTVYNFVQENRLEKAYQLITGCGYNVSESAFAVGYSNLSHFSKVFKIKFGISPGKIARKTQS